MTAVIIASLAVAMTAGESEILATMDSDLQFLLSEFAVPEKIQIILVQLGSKSLATFAVMADDRPTFRAAVATDVINAAEAGLSAAHATLARTITTGLIAAWMAADGRVSAKAKVDAEGSVLRLPNLLSLSLIHI